jgi:8-amino-7-oxononanoate synthase
MFQIQKIPGRTVNTDKGEFLWFGGTSYLGMPHHTQFQNLIKFGLDNFGANWGSSRNNPLQLKIYDELEMFLANFSKAPQALTVSSGMLAGQLVLNYLNNEFGSHEIIYAPNVHPALWALGYKPNKQSFKSFSEQINQQINQTKSDVITIFADAVSSPHIENYNFDWVQNLPKRKINIVIDDSHSLGICGEKGSGIYSTVPQNENVNLIVVASLNKTLGVLGGVILGSESHLARIKKMPFFAGCSPISPAYAYACANAGKYYEKELETLKVNVAYFNSLIANVTDKVNLDGNPAYCFQKEGLYEFLLTKGILVPSFAYPNPTDKKVTRLVISSLHNFDDIKYLSDCLHEIP